MPDGPAAGRPAIDTDQRFAEAILTCSGTTNGELATHGFRDLERKTGRKLADLSEGSEEKIITFAQTQGDRHRLALVEVSTSGPEQDQLRYVSDAFTHLEPSATTRSYNEVWRDYWERGGPPR